MDKQLIEGYLTYFGAFILLIGGLVAFILGKLNFEQLMTIIGVGLSIAGIRRAIGRVERVDKKNSDQTKPE